jgi:hypothetical protein
MIRFKQFLNEKKDRSPKPEMVTVYHGTTEKNVADIKKKGLIDRQGVYSPTWYMVATDFKSALFHSNATEDDGAVVIEFAVPITSELWDGHPWFWPPNVRDRGSKWYAPTKAIPKKFIKKIHKVSFEDFVKNK